MSRAGGNKQIRIIDLEEALAGSPETYGHLDLIAFGFPCQDISVANPKGKGLAGKKSSLFHEAIRIVRLLMPEWILIENVPGLLSHNKGRDFGIVLREVAESGYGYCWNVLDSRWFSVAQRRRRLFIAGRFGRFCPCEILSEPAGHQRHVPQDDEISPASNCVNARTGSRQDPSVETYIAKTINTGQRGNNYEWWENYIASTVTANHGINNAKNDTFIARSVNTNRRSGSNAGQENYIAEPYPDGERKAAGSARGLDTARGVVIGNGITVPVFKWIGKRIIEYELKTKD